MCVKTNKYRLASVTRCTFWQVYHPTLNSISLSTRKCNCQTKWEIDRNHEQHTPNERVRDFDRVLTYYIFLSHLPLSLIFNHSRVRFKLFTQLWTFNSPRNNTEHLLLACKSTKNKQKSHKTIRYVMIMIIVSMVVVWPIKVLFIWCEIGYETAAQTVTMHHINRQSNSSALKYFFAY